MTSVHDSAPSPRRMPSSVSRKTKAAEYQKSQKCMERLLTIMDVLILFFCNVLELLVSRVSRDDKVYELDSALNRVRQKEITVTHLSCRGLSAFIHPPTRKNCVLDIRQIKGRKYSVRIAGSVWTPNASNKDSFLALRPGTSIKWRLNRQPCSAPVQDDKCLFQRRQPVCDQTRSTTRRATPHHPLHVAQR